MSKFEQYLIESEKPIWDGTPKSSNCHSCGQLTNGYGGHYKGGEYCDDCLEEIEINIERNLK